VENNPEIPSQPVNNPVNSLPNQVNNQPAIPRLSAHKIILLASVLLLLILILLLGGYFYLQKQNSKKTNQNNNSGSLTKQQTDLLNQKASGNTVVYLSVSDDNGLYSFWSYDLGNNHKKIIGTPFLPLKQEGVSIAVSPNNKYIAVVGEKQLPSSVTQNYHGYKDYNGYKGRIYLSIFSIDDFSTKTLVDNLIPTNDYANTLYINTGVAWSPDSKQVVFLSGQSGKPELWITNINGSGLKQITNDSTPTVKTDYSWSPDGTKILYRTNLSIKTPVGTEATETTGPSIIKVYDLTKGVESVISSSNSQNPILKQLTNEYYIRNKRLQWLDSDSITLVFESFSDESKPDTQGIWKLSLSTMEPKRIVAKPIDPNEDFYTSPDRKNIVFTTHREGVKPGVGIQSAEITSWIVNMDTQEITPLPNKVRNAVWSSDSKYLCFDDFKGLWVYSLESKQTTKLVGLTGKDHTSFPAITFSSDSNKIMYQQVVNLYLGNTELTKDEDEQQGTWIINRDGTGLTRFSESAIPMLWY